MQWPTEAQFQILVSGGGLINSPTKLAEEENVEVVSRA